MKSGQVTDEMRTRYQINKESMYNISHLTLSSHTTRYHRSVLMTMIVLCYYQLVMLLLLYLPRNTEYMFVVTLLSNHSGQHNLSYILYSIYIHHV